MVRPREGPYPEGMATELPGTGVALGQDSSSGSESPDPAHRGRSPASARRAPIAFTTSSSAARLCPLTSASQ